MTADVIIGTLSIIASLSPMLTMAALWQTKEWRLDRMKEYLRSEGMPHLWGVSRPALFAAALLGTWMIPHASGRIGAGLTVILATLAGLQWGLRRQRMPAWTQKAALITSLSVCVTVGICISLTMIFTVSITPIVVLLQPLIVSVAVAAVSPIDAMLKKRVFARAAKLRAEHNDLIVIAVTGSVGKTTVKELLGHILSDRAAVTPAHVNTEMGVSEWLIRLLGNHDSRVPECLVIEMGAYRRGEIALMCSVAKPMISIVTFVGQQHIALFGSQEKLRRAKGEIVEALPTNGHAFLNADSSLCATLKDLAPCPVTTVGTGGTVDMEAFEIEETAGGIRFVCDGTRYETPLRGTHNVTNVLLAIAVAKHLGVSPKIVADRLRSFVPPSRTFRMKEVSGVTVLDDTHNASSTSLKAAIAWARSQPHAHKTLLTDGLIELGEEEESIHAELGALAEKVFDRVIFLNKRRSCMFAKGYKTHPIEMLEKNTEAVSRDSLLVCVGRMSEKTYSSLLP